MKIKTFKNFRTIDESSGNNTKLAADTRRMYDCIAKMQYDIIDMVSGCENSVMDISNGDAYAIETAGGELHEGHITALHVNKKGSLEYMTDEHEEWWDIQFGDVYFEPTLVNVALAVCGL